MSSSSGSAASLTARGLATRGRIVAAAAGLMYERGVAATSMDDVRAATATSKSQLYHYFTSKSDLVCAVIAHQQEAVLGGQQPHLAELDTLAGLRTWRDRVVAVNGEAMRLGGCPVGALATQVATDERARDAAGSAFEAWRSQLAAGLGRMQAAGELSGEASPEDLSWGLLAAVQGGLLLSQATQQIRPLELALDHAIAAIAAYAA